MIHFQLAVEIADPSEVAALAESIRAVCTERVSVTRSTGDDGDHRLVVERGGPLDSAFQQDLNALFQILISLMPEWGPGGHWRLTWVPGPIVDEKADTMNDLERLLRAVVDEARSERGVSGRSVRAAIAAADRAERQIATLRRIVAELRDDGITDAALDAAEETLRIDV